MTKPIDTATPAVSAISIHVPRLADFTLSDKSPLISKRVVSAGVRLLDFLIVLAGGVWIAYSYVADASAITDAFYLLAALGTAALVLVTFEIFGLYKVQTFTSVVTQLPRVVFAWTCAFTILLTSLFLLKQGAEFSRVWLVSWYCFGGLVLLATRVVLANKTRQWLRAGRLYRRAVVFGSGRVAQEVLSDLEADPDSDIRICGIFDERRDERVPELTAGYPMLGGLADLVDFVANTRVDIVIVALPVTAERRIDKVMKVLSGFNADIKLPGCASPVRLSKDAYSSIGSVPMLDLTTKPLSDWGMVAKWALDKIVAGASLVALAPVLAVVAIAIKLDSKGPILFRQKRYGRNNELIEVFKFRSMYVEMSDASASRLVTKDDVRVTPIGRFIRKTSLDELPQLLNVLRGDLSLVGPRPHALQAKAANKLYDEVVDDYYLRHRVKPGITGWAQINGWRGETDTVDKIRQRVAHDLYYIDNWSLLLDLYILVATPFALVKSENAY